MIDTYLLTTMDGILNDEEKNRTEVVKVEVDSSSEKDQPQPSSSRISRFLEKLRGYEDALDRKLGVESHSIERKLPEQRNPFYARPSSQLVSVAYLIMVYDTHQEVLTRI